MQALRFRSYGPPSVLTIEDIPTPEPAPGEVLVRVEAAGLNPSDQKNVLGAFKATLPRTPGRDLAGEIISGDRKGTHVWASLPGFGNTHDGTHAQFVAAPLDALSVRPMHLTAEQAASVGVPFTTAWGALMRAAKLKPGETVLIIGAAGAVGQAATQIANWKGACAIGGVRGDQSAPGTFATPDTSREDFPARVHELTGGKGADVVFDTVGGAMFEPSLQCLAKHGRQVAISSTASPRVTFNLIDFYHKSLHLIGFDSYAYTMHEIAEVFDELRAGFETGALKPPEIQAIPFANAIDAYNAIASGTAKTKIVLSM
jgi:NADPH:quinone reductase-like Zn-dependent oxidoreductase